MKIRTFMQVGTQKVVAINMDLVEAIFPNDGRTGSIIRLHGWENGETNDWEVTDSLNDLVTSLRADKN